VVDLSPTTNMFFGTPLKVHKIVRWKRYTVIVFKHYRKDKNVKSSCHNFACTYAGSLEHLISETTVLFSVQFQKIVMNKRQNDKASSIEYHSSLVFCDCIFRVHSSKQDVKQMCILD
jgi:hypothetical protein